MDSAITRLRNTTEAYVVFIVLAVATALAWVTEEWWVAVIPSMLLGALPRVEKALGKVLGSGILRIR